MNIASPRARALAYGVMLIAATAVITSTSQEVAISHDAVPQDAIWQHAASHHRGDFDRKDDGDAGAAVPIRCTTLYRMDSFQRTTLIRTSLIRGASCSPRTPPVWVNDNGTGHATLYDGLGVKQGLVITIPPPTGGTPPSLPTGIVSNSSMGFVVSLCDLRQAERGRPA
jgi:hypothetical protein